MTIEKIKELSVSFDDSFIELADLITTLKSEDPDDFKKVWTETPISRRRAYALERIGKLIRSDKIPTERLIRIGWTKLEILLRRDGAVDDPDLLKLAEEMKARQLARHVRDRPPIDHARLMLFEFDPEQYRLVKAVLLRHGASEAGRGLAGKEAALCAALEAHAQPTPPEADRSKPN